MKKKHQKAIDLIKEKGYEGTDISTEISLLEYNMVWKEEIGEETHSFILKRGKEYYLRQMSKEDFEKICAENWFNIQSVLDYVGIETKEDFIDTFPHCVSDTVQYWGIDNMFGSCYYPQTLKEISKNS